jgi:hypothetical protein
MGGGYLTQPFYHMAPRQTMPYSTSDFGFNDPFSEDAGGGLLEMEGGRNIQDAKVAKGRRGVWIMDL